MKKIALALSLSFIFILIAATIGWYSLNNYVIPRIIIPALRQEIIQFNHDYKANLKVKDIYFHPLRGFQLKGIELKPLITAKEVDVDLDCLAIFSHQIHILAINVAEGELNIVRSRQDKWNYDPAVKAVFQPKKVQKNTWLLVIDQITISRSHVFFNDRRQRRNQLARHFQNVNLKVKQIGEKAYAVEMAGEDIKYQDKVWLAFKSYGREKLLKGTVKLKVADLAQYWNYYLDEIMAPWHLTKAGLEAKADFSLRPGEVMVDGVYAVRNGQINYGDIKLASNCSIKHHQKLVKGEPILGLISAEAEFNNLSFFFDKENVLEKGECLVGFNGKAVVIKKLKGISQEKPVNLTGKFGLGWPRRLDLAGKIGRSDNLFHLKMLTDNTALVDWLASTEASYLKASVNMSDLKRLLFSADVSGRTELHKFSLWLKDDLKDQLTISLEAGAGDISGRLGFSGKISGKLDQPASLTGQLGLKFDDFSIMGLEPLSFLLGMKADKGVFYSAIPPMHLYQGDLSGEVVLDSDHWGVELDLKNADLAKFAKVDPKLTGLKGMLTGKVACVGDWKKNDSIHGGGTFSLTNADLKSASIFASTQQGVGSVVKGFEMPDFKEVKGNFEISREVVSFNNALAKAPNMELRGSGTLDFDRHLNFTMGVKFIQKQNLQTTLLVFFPLQSIGFDFLTKAVKVEIKGTLPDIQQTTSVQPLGWLKTSYTQQSNFDPDQYSLEKLWP